MGEPNTDWGKDLVTRVAAIEKTFASGRVWASVAILIFSLGGGTQIYPVYWGRAKENSDAIQSNAEAIHALDSKLSHVSGQIDVIAALAAVDDFKGAVIVMAPTKLEGKWCQNIVLVKAIFGTSMKFSAMVTGPKDTSVAEAVLKLVASRKYAEAFAKCEKKSSVKMPDNVLTEFSYCLKRLPPGISDQLSRLTKHAGTKGDYSPRGKWKELVADMIDFKSYYAGCTSTAKQPTKTAGAPPASRPVLAGRGE